MSNSNKRELYRIEYPKGKFAQFVESRGIFKVEDVHERSMRFHRGEIHFVKSFSVKGELVFRCGAKIKLKGVIVKTRGTDVIVDFETAIPYHVIVKEQAYLRNGES